jgi:hypothetical protein
MILNTIHFTNFSKRNQNGRRKQRNLATASTSRFEHGSRPMGIGKVKSILGCLLASEANITLWRQVVV